MEHENLHIISLVVAGISGALLFWRGLRLGMIRRYSLVYAYIAVSLLREGLGEVLARQLDVQSPLYVWLYAWFSLVHAGVGIGVLLWIYYLRRKPSLADWHVVGFLGLLLTRSFFWADSIWISYRVLTAAQMLRTYLGVIAFLRLFWRSRMLPGWNLTMVLLAITLPSVFQSAILAMYMFGVDGFSYSFSSLGMEVTTLGSWLILVIGMWDYSPPVRVRLPQPLLGQVAKARVWANIKALWELR